MIAHCSQIDNIAEVKVKWDSIMRVWGETVEAANEQDTPSPSSDDESDESDESWDDSTDDDRADAPAAPAARHPKVQTYLNRFIEAKVFYPAFFEEDATFWAAQPPDAVYAPFPDGTIPGRFVYPLTPLPNHPMPMSPTGEYLMQTLDTVDAPLTPGALINGDVALKRDQLWDDERQALKKGGCKTGRDLTVLILYSSEGRKPEGRTAFNPTTDVSKGEVALVRMEDPNDTPGQRGWDLALHTRHACRAGGQQDETQGREQCLPGVLCMHWTCDQVFVVHGDLEQEAI